MKALLVIMTGIGFTLGVVLGLLLHLPTDSLPAEHNSFLSSDARHRRNVDTTLEVRVINRNSLADLRRGNANDIIEPARLLSNEKAGEKDPNGKGDNPVINNRGDELSGRKVQRRLPVGKQNKGGKQDKPPLANVNIPNSNQGGDRNPAFEGEILMKQSDGINGFNEPNKDMSHDSSISHTQNRDEVKGGNRQNPSPEDDMYLRSLVRGILWTEKLEQSCPRAFKSTKTESWKKKSESMDVVKMEEGCGRMQNRMLTFRDASKACARYRLNTDQIQGEIFSYYLAKMLNISNLPPTSLALVNSADHKWRTVHLDLSLAQWADSKLVVLTQFIDGLEAAHIPQAFREDHRQLHPILAHLGSKPHAELCELLQWSDLIVFDYLTANLDRVINNMFNRQWNDQIMESPAHNLEKFKDGNLVFLDNESGLFHGFRLIEKYEVLHRALLDSLCIFRSSTASIIKRLASSGSVGTELRALLQKHEPLHRHVANMPQKNLKILQSRIDQVHEQISKCEKMYNS